MQWRDASNTAKRGRAGASLGQLAAKLALAALFIAAFAGCNHQKVVSEPPPPPAEVENDASEPADATPEPRMQRGEVWNKGQPSDVTAAWYEVPDDSLAKRRAGLEELTAANNRLPIGTLVRVTHLANGKSVDVRITDRGITDRHVKLDLCKEAAEKLGMVSKGVARVRMQVIEEEPKIAGEAGGSASPDTQTAAAER